MMIFPRGKIQAVAVPNIAKCIMTFNLGSPALQRHLARFETEDHDTAGILLHHAVLLIVQCKIIMKCFTK